MPPARSKTLAFIIRLLGTLVTTALFIWLISRQNWAAMLDKAAGIVIWAVILALGFYLLSYGFNTLRWCILLWAQGVKISFWQAFRLNWAGTFASNFLPSTIGGDGFRILAVQRYTGRTTISVGSVALDRIINMAAMVCLIPAPLMIFGTSVLFRGHLLPELNSQSKHLLPTPGSDHAGAAERVALAFIPPGVLKLIEKYFSKFVSAVKLWGAKPWAFVYAFLAAWPSNLFAMAATYLLARQLGMNVSFWQVIGIQTVSYFLAVLPISVNGYGLREVAFTTLFTALGSGLEQASTLALITRFLSVLSTLPGAIWFTTTVTGVGGAEKPSEA
jgi:uncharacterized membrane protein YbhN (UPF0104 family)